MTVATGKGMQLAYNQISAVFKCMGYWLVWRRLAGSAINVHPAKML